MSSHTTKLRLGIVGLGAMGHPHVGFALTSPDIELTALCDIDPSRFDRIRDAYFACDGASGPAAPVSSSAFPLVARPAAPQAMPPTFTDARALLDSGLVDAVLIATPHYDHQPIAIAAFQRGIHVLCEKPLTVTVQGGQAMLDAWQRAKATKPGLLFGEMFMQRTYGHWRKIKSLIEAGELGKLVRCTWIVTDWYRTQHYYNSGGWRATWAGEGGGVLTNQSPHNLDLLQWFLGMPATVNAFGGLAKYHDIAVEDEVSAVLRYADGAVAHFITTTAESPGTNRLEIIGENGKLVYEKGELVFQRNRSSMKAWSDTTSQSYKGPECWNITLPFEHHGESGHRLTIQNFARAVLHGEPLVCPASEGINQVILTNALMVSLLDDGRPVTPAQAGEFAAKLQELVKAEGQNRARSGHPTA